MTIFPSPNLRAFPSPDIRTFPGSDPRPLASTDPRPASSVASRVPFLDTVRSVAIVLVLACHFRHLAGAPQWFVYIGLRGNVGVDIFFVLSGFLIGGQLLRTLARRGNLDLARFWVRRALRTMPVYYVMFAVFVATHDVTSATALPMLTFLQNYAAPSDWPITWSLCIEEHFYLVLPLLLMLVAAATRNPRKIAAVAVAMIAVSPVLRGLFYDQLAGLTHNEFLAVFYSPTHLRLEGLFLGVAAAAVHQFNLQPWTLIKRHARLVRNGGIGLFIIATWHPALVGTSTASISRLSPYCAVAQFAIVSAVTAAVILAGIALHERRPKPAAGPGRWLADHAYTLYLTHCVARQCVFYLQEHIHLGFAPALATSILLSLGMAMLLRTLVELPALRFRDSLAPSRGRLSGVSLNN